MEHSQLHNQEHILLYSVKLPNYLLQH